MNIQTIFHDLAIKDEFTLKHSISVQKYAVNFSQILKLTQKEINETMMIGFLHDVGKLFIDKTILEKQTTLDLDEYATIKQHPNLGYLYLKNTCLNKYANQVLMHHERWDGKGYPNQLKESQIPLETRIITIVDAYDAMTQKRSYRKPMPKKEVINEFEKNSGLQFDPDLTKIFLEKFC